jgi:uncharacterized membrane protein YkvI
VIDTSTSTVHAFLDRIDNALAEAGRKVLGRSQRAAAIGLTLLAAFGLSQAGVIGLVARGYTLLAYGFLLVFVLPLVTRRVNLIWRSGKSAQPAAA